VPTRIPRLDMQKVSFKVWYSGENQILRISFRMDSTRSVTRESLTLHTIRLFIIPVPEYQFSFVRFSVAILCPSRLPECSHKVFHDYPFPDLYISLYIIILSKVF